ncbi:MAG: hypothetical protein HN348_28590, partial [Proteobacteria bacterium]|nr:hypothetical protein [Pseudomonadota bacterium]
EHPGQNPEFLSDDQRFISQLDGTLHWFDLSTGEGGLASPATNDLQFYESHAITPDDQAAIASYQRMDGDLWMVELK